MTQPGFQRHCRQKGGIELLLVLCCLVGVVIFFSFTLGIAGIIHDHPGFDGLPDIDELQQKLAKLNQEKSSQDIDLKLLKKRKESYQEQMYLVNKNINPDLPFSNGDVLKREISSLTNKFNRLVEQVEKSNTELAGLDQLSTGTLEEKLKELDKIQTKLRNLDRKIDDSKLRLLESDAPHESNPNLKNKRDQLKKDLTALEKRQNKLEEEIKQAEIKKLWGGVGSFNNPLFVECVKGGVIFYPGSQRVSIDKLNQDGLFKNKASKHDAIVMLVRPDGYESYRKSYWKVINTKKKVSYEPVDAATSIEFLK